MPLTLIRPTLDDEKKADLKEYLWTKWLRAKAARQAQVEGEYAKWSTSYEAEPLEKIRTVPFYKSSNLVVPVIRIFLDTFVARTLNVMFATRPLYVVEGLPADLKEGAELYLNRKAIYDWGHYAIARDLLSRGNKNGTVTYKVPYVECKTIDVMPLPGSTSSYSEEEYIRYQGPKACPIPFEDFYCYPITANNLEEIKVKFNRIRYVEEEATRLVKSGEWSIPEGKDIETYCKIPQDAKRMTQQGAAKVIDTYTRELHIIEAELDWAVTNDSSRYYSVVVLFEEFTGDIFDLYYHPYPGNICIYTDYRPFPQEDLYFGTSLCKILGMAQEEASRIHNERRDNSTIASAVCFKRKNGSQLPNPSTNWYPGKVWDLDDMDDLDVINIGRNYSDMIEQEDYVFNLAEKVSGIGEIMQAASTGALGKRGIYNTMGTIGVVAEGNQRQDTNIRDARVAIGAIGALSYKIQAFGSPDDPIIDTLPTSAQQPARDAIAFLRSPKARYITLEVKTSNAGINAEVQKANLMAISQTLNQYGQTVMQLAPQVLNQQMNPALRAIIADIVQMQRNMAKRLLKAFDEWDAIEDLPDVNQQQQGGAGGGPGAPQGGGPVGMPAQSGAAQNPGGWPSRGLLGDLASLPQAPAGSAGTTGLVPQNGLG